MKDAHPVQVLPFRVQLLTDKWPRLSDGQRIAFTLCAVFTRPSTRQAFFIPSNPTALIVWSGWTKAFKQNNFIRFTILIGVSGVCRLQPSCSAWTSSSTMSSGYCRLTWLTSCKFLNLEEDTVYQSYRRGISLHSAYSSAIWSLLLAEVVSRLKMRSEALLFLVWVLWLHSIRLWWIRPR